MRCTAQAEPLTTEGPRKYPRSEVVKPTEERAHLSHLFKVGAYVLHRVGHVCDEDDAAGSRGRKTEERTLVSVLVFASSSSLGSLVVGSTRTSARPEGIAREMRGFARVMETGLVFMVLR